MNIKPQELHELLEVFGNHFGQYSQEVRKTEALAVRVRELEAENAKLKEAAAPHYTFTSADLKKAHKKYPNLHRRPLR